MSTKDLTNATPTFTYDLTELNLNSVHTIYVKFGAKGYVDSNASNVVEYVVKPETTVETEENEAGGLTYEIVSEDYITETDETGGITYDIGGTE